MRKSQLALKGLGRFIFFMGISISMPRAAGHSFFTDQ